MKKYLIYTGCGLLLLSLGAYGGYELAARYFKTTSTMDLVISKTHQAYTYANQFGQENDVKAKQKILSDLKLNLIRLQLMRFELQPGMKGHVCSQLQDITENKSALIDFSLQTGDMESKITLSTLIDDIEQCRSW